MNLVYQKYIIISFLLSINIILATTSIIYTNYWYLFLILLALASITNTASSILILLYKMVKKNNIIYRLNQLNYTYIVPCYNESEEELIKTLNSITIQQHIPDDKRSLIIVCDGKVIGSTNLEPTNVILIKILKPIYISLYKYTPWDNKYNTVELYKGVYNKIPYILLIKHNNYGKRDSIVLARKLCYNYNNKILTDPMISKTLMVTIGAYFDHIYSSESIKYIIGIDADTIFDYNCSYELIKSIDRDNDVHGCVGYVDIVAVNMFHPFILYQYSEYMFAQCLKRHAQSNITHKVNCLSGCNQILRISEETCGEKILSQFNYLPSNENIFDQIRSYASEDRNHVCLMLSIYPHVKSIQTLKAIAYTSVPETFNVFISQRRRWSLGSNTNDMMLTYLPGINIFERILAAINVMTFSIQPFIVIATIIFIKTIITEPTLLMLYLAILILMPFLYSIMVPIFIKQLCFRDAMYYYFSYLFFFTCGSIVNLLIYFYALFNMDIIKWGKTRSIKPSNENQNQNNYNVNINEDDHFINNDEFWEVNGKEQYNAKESIV